MIHGVFGKLGSGKGLYVMDVIADELINGFRDVVTNVPLRIVPWVNGQGKGMIGLRAYVSEKCPELDDDDLNTMMARIYLDEDIDHGHDLYLWRRDGDTGEWFKLPISKTDDKGRPERFDATVVKARHCAPCLVVIDEAWAFFPNNGGYSRDPVLKFYSKQQRKLRDECFIVTQHPTDCDEVFWKIAQDFRVCRNHGMERMGIFRQPEMFRVITYLTNPAKGNAIRSHESYKTLDKRLSQCYDTTAGVGFGGGHAGDSGQKKKGLHFAWLAVAIVLLVAFLIAVPYMMSNAAKPFFRRTFTGRSIAPQKSISSSNDTVTKANVTVTDTQQCGNVTGNDTSTLTNQIVCTGFVILGNTPIAFMSDGSTVTSPDLQRVEKNAVVIEGKRYVIKLGHAETDYVPDVAAPVSYPLPVSSPAQAQSTVSFVRGKQLQPPGSVHGFDRMKGSL